MHEPKDAPRLFRHLVAARGVPSPWAFATGVGAIVLVGLADVLTGSQIRLFYLYTLPLILVGLHCAHPVQLMACAASVMLSDALVGWAQSMSPLVMLAHAPLKAFQVAAVLAVAKIMQSNQRNATHLARTDLLTGLPNRRAFEIALTAQITRCKRYGETFSIAVVDLDGFKAVNDSGGHQAGDIALRHVAAVLHECTRASDVAARIGGDEFAVLMPNISSQDTRAYCRRLCMSLQRRMREHGLALTASFGSTTYSIAPDDWETALSQADAAMYEAKRAGRNRVIARESR